MLDPETEVSPECEHSHSRGSLVCGRCGTVISGSRPWHQYCSNACRVAAGRARTCARIRKMEGLIADLAKAARREG